MASTLTRKASQPSLIEWVIGKFRRLRTLLRRHERRKSEVVDPKETFNHRESKCQTPFVNPALHSSKFGYNVGHLRRCFSLSDDTVIQEPFNASSKNVQSGAWSQAPISSHPELTGILSNWSLAVRPSLSYHNSRNPSQTASRVTSMDSIHQTPNWCSEPQKQRSVAQSFKRPATRDSGYVESDYANPSACDRSLPCSPMSPQTGNFGLLTRDPQQLLWPNTFQNMRHSSNNWTSAIEVIGSKAQPLSNVAHRAISHVGVPNFIPH